MKIRLIDETDAEYQKRTKGSNTLLSCLLYQKQAEKILTTASHIQNIQKINSLYEACDVKRESVTGTIKVNLPPRYKCQK